MSVNAIHAPELSVRATATVNPHPMRVGVVPRRRTRDLAADALRLLGIVFTIPFAILAIGMPLMLVIRLLLWVAGLL
jgi:hypothetical protein